MTAATLVSGQNHVTLIIVEFRARSYIPKQDGGKCHMVDKKESSGEEHLAAYSGVGITAEFLIFFSLNFLSF